MKKIALILLAGVMVFGLAACGGNSAGGSSEFSGAMSGSSVEDIGFVLPAGISIDADYANVSYADLSATEVLNIYLPDEPTGNDPLIVLAHGGGFMFGDQNMGILEPVVKSGKENGYVVATVDYRKSGEAAFPAALADVKAAVRFLRANAMEYGIDPEKVVMWGESAGAYLADMTALTPNVAELNGDVTDNVEFSTEVSAMVSFYAPVEFYTMDEEFLALGKETSANHSQNSFETNFLGFDDMTSDKDAVYRTWWGSYKDQIPATLKAWIQSGTADNNVPCTQSENLANGLKEILGEDAVHFNYIEGAGHEDDLFYTDENLAEIFAFLAETLQK